MDDAALAELGQRLDALAYPRTSEPRTSEPRTSESDTADDVRAELRARGLQISFDPEVGDVASHAQVLSQELEPFTRGRALSIDERRDSYDVTKMFIDIRVGEETSTVEGEHLGGKWLHPTLLAAGFAGALERLGHSLTLFEDRSIEDQCVHWILLPEPVAEWLFEQAALDVEVVVEANIDPDIDDREDEWDDEDDYDEEE